MEEHLVLMTVLTVVFGVTTLIGVALTVYYGKKAATLERRRKQFEWTDLQACMSDLGSRSKRDFTPDVIFTPGLRGATLVNLLLSEYDGPVPVYVGMSFWKDGVGEVVTSADTHVIETNKWVVHVPGQVASRADDRILVVDDFAMSGDFLTELRRLLVSLGFQPENIRTMCAVTTKIAIENKKAPDFWWYAHENTDFYFPWGKAR